MDKQILDKMEKFKNFPKGWEFGTGVPLDPRVEMVATWIYEYVEDLDLDGDAFPCNDGSILLVFFPTTWPVVKSLEVAIWGDEGISGTLEKSDYVHERDKDKFLRDWYVVEEFDDMTLVDIRRELEKLLESEV